MMKFKFDFSLYYSPTQPYACVTGHLEMPSQPELEGVVQLVGETEEAGALALKVNAVLSAGPDRPPILMLDDHVADSLAEAELLARYLEKEHKFFVDVY
jgi:hypothetical protein